MNLEERMYSESELRGRSLDNESGENQYTASEINNISDLFDEFYSEKLDNYSGVDEAFEDFVDAYNNVRNVSYADYKVNHENQDKEEKKASKKASENFQVSPKASTVIATGVGAGAGFLAAHALTKKARKEISEIEDKMVTGRASSKDIERLSELKKSLRNKKLLGLTGGAVTGYGVVKGSSRLKSTQNSAEDFVEDTYPVLTTAALIGGAKLVGAGIAGGGAVGNIASRIKNRKIKRRIKALKKQDTLSWAESQELKRLEAEFKQKVLKSTGRGAVIGGASALGGAVGGGLKAAALAKTAIASKIGAAGKVIAGAMPTAGAGTGIASAVASGGTAAKLIANSDKKLARKQVVEKAKASARSKALLGGAVGAGAGLGISVIATKKLRASIKELSSKADRTTAEDLKLTRLKKKLVRIKVLSTAGGALAGGAVGSQVKK
jgi:hypothetical protein